MILASQKIAYQNIFHFKKFKICSPQKVTDFCMICIFPNNLIDQDKKELDVIHPHKNLHRCARKFRGVHLSRRPPALVFTSSCTRTQVSLMWERNRTTIKPLLRYCALSGTNQWKAPLNSGHKWLFELSKKDSLRSSAERFLNFTFSAPSLQSVMVPPLYETLCENLLGTFFPPFPLNVKCNSYQGLRLWALPVLKVEQIWEETDYQPIQQKTSEMK